MIALIELMPPILGTDAARGRKTQRKLNVESILSTTSTPKDELARRNGQEAMERQNQAGEIRAHADDGRAALEKSEEETEGGKMTEKQAQLLDRLIDRTCKADKELCRMEDEIAGLVLSLLGRDGSSGINWDLGAWICEGPKKAKREVRGWMKQARAAKKAGDDRAYYEYEWARKHGPARAKALSKAQRKEIAKKAAAARWGKNAK